MLIHMLTSNITITTIYYLIINNQFYNKKISTSHIVWGYDNQYEK